MINEANIFRSFQWNHDAAELLGKLNSDLVTNGKISKDNINRVKLFHSNHVEYQKLIRKEAGCGWYTDAEGKTRSIATDELEDDYLERSIKKLERSAKK